MSFTCPYLQDLELALDLLLFNGLEDLDNAALVCDNIEPLKHLAVLAAPNLAHHLIVILQAGQQGQLTNGGRTSFQERCCLLHRKWLVSPTQKKRACMSPQMQWGSPCRI